MAIGGGGMTDFGHRYARCPGICIDIWGAGPFIIGRWRFEDSDRFGPNFIRKDGQPRNPPKEYDSFWNLYKRWRDNNRPMEKDGITCIT
jgi:hypothetical protein